MLASLFYPQIALACQQCGQAVKMQPSVIMAQVANETGYQIGPHKNLTNIKYFAPGSGYQSGVYYLKNDVIAGGPLIAYENYASITQWGKAYVHVLNLSVYKSCHGLANYVDTCHALGNSPFAQSGYRYDTNGVYYGVRGQVLIDMIVHAGLTKYDKGYSVTGGQSTVNNNNTNAVLDAQKAQAAKVANAKIVAQTNANELAKANALKASQALAKAKLTKDPGQIAKAQASVNSQKKNSVIPTQNKTKANVLKGGFGLVGLISLIIVFKYGYDL